VRRALVLTGLALALAVAAAVSQTGRGAAGPEAAPKPLAGLPAYTAGYRAWTRLNKRPIPPRAGGDAHGGTKNVYSSKRKAGARYPAGTIIVKEAFRPGTKFVGLIAVMRKLKRARIPGTTTGR
jgi:hypothetical protein